MCCNWTDVTETFTVGEQIWGDWKTPVQCPAGFYVSGVNIALQPAQGTFSDDQGATGLMMRCTAWKTDFPAATSDITIQAKGAGNWQGWRVCSNPKGFITSAQLRIESDQGGASDDTGPQDTRPYFLVLFVYCEIFLS